MFLVRFDDICPTMNWDIWDQIESILCDLDIKPILAVIPDNRDQEFKYCDERDNFWDCVRRWQALGWSIGLHGYQHLYVTTNAGLLNWSSFSEFSGLKYEQQKSKLEKAIAIFRHERIEPRIWVAPAHSFDETTLRVLKELGIKIISDGFSFQPYLDLEKLFWIPVQVSRFRSICSFGTWTVCLHHNTWTQKELNRFRHDVTRFRKKITNLDDVLVRHGGRSYSFADLIFKHAYRYALRARRIQYISLGNH